MVTWKTFRNEEMIVPAIGRRVHFIDALDGECCAAELIDFTDGTDDDSTPLEVTLLAYEPSDGEQMVMSGVLLSGVDGPTFPNWHYTNHNPSLVP